MAVLVTGGAGFIGSNFVLDWLDRRDEPVINLAAESHVDRSIHGPGEFIATSIVGTFGLLEAVRRCWGSLPEAARAASRLLHVSTEEV